MNNVGPWALAWMKCKAATCTLVLCAFQVFSVVSVFIFGAVDANVLFDVE